MNEVLWAAGIYVVVIYPFIKLLQLQRDERKKGPNRYGPDNITAVF